MLEQPLARHLPRHFLRVHDLFAPRVGDRRVERVVEHVLIELAVYLAAHPSFRFVPSHFASPFDPFVSRHTPAGAYDALRITSRGCSRPRLPAPGSFPRQAQARWDEALSTSETSCS